MLLGFKDLLITPIYLLFTLFFANAINMRVHRNEPHLRKMFTWGIYTRIIGAIAFAIIYSFFYGGDTTNYFIKGSGVIWDAFMESPGATIEMLFGDAQHPSADARLIISRMAFWDGSIAIIRITAFVDILTLHTYIPDALIFGLFCFSGLWAIYKIFLERYPQLYKPLGYLILFSPSVVFWGSGVMKDPVTLGSLGWVFYLTCRIFINRKNIIRNTILLLFFSWLIYILKIYIIIFFIPTIFLWIFLHFNKNIKSASFRALSKPFAIISGVFFGYILSEAIVADNNLYALDNVLASSQSTAMYLKYASIQSGGAYYDLGEIDYTPLGILKVFPQAVNVTLFRPYLWESHNPIMLISAIEAFGFFCFTLYSISKAIVNKKISIVYKDPFILFLLLFSILFSFAIGLSTSNFGTLVRYKIPMIPFYLSAIYLIQYYGGKRKPSI